MVLKPQISSNTKLFNSVIKRNENTASFSKPGSTLYFSATGLTLEEHYLLLALDLVYNGIIYCWDPKTRINSVAGNTIKFYNITKDSGTSGKSGSGKFDLNICNSLNKEICSANPSCVYKEKTDSEVSKPTGSCNLKDNFIICSKKCQNSRWYMLNLEKHQGHIDKVLCICLCWGSNFSEIEFEGMWRNGFRDILLKILSMEGYNQLMINGHSMGAGLTYLVTLEIFKDDEIKSLIIPKIDTFENLYIHLFGMGRLPILSVLKFQKFKEDHKFNVYDIISYDKTKNIFDSRIDNIKVNAADCDYLSTRNPDFYCLNFSKKKSANKAKAISHHLTKKNLPSSFTPAQKEEYKNCLTESGWGDLYSPEWQKCQELMDKYHMHNTVETYLISNDGNLIKGNKNEISHEKNVKDIDPNTKEHPSGLLHSIKTYKNYFMEFLKSNNAI